VAYIKQPRQAIPLLLLFFVWQHAWWVLHGAKAGRVMWHPTNINFDNFGPQMVIGLPAAYYFAMGARSKWLKWAALAAAAGCIVGTIASFARGAAVSAAAVLFWVWFRSPRKGWTTVAMVGAVVLVMFLGGAVYVAERRGGGAEKSFFTEMMSIGAEDDVTEDDRMVLWTLAVRVFLKRPIFGAGAANFGPYAAENFEAGDVGGNYDANPGRLYDRDLHSTFFQILCEGGIVGSLLFAWLLLDFWRKNRAVRSPPHLLTWSQTTDGRLDLKQLSLGLECAMVSFLCTAFFYNQLYLPWLWGILGINLLLYGLTRPSRAVPSSAGRSRHV
jgi:O-antigen ligase